MTPNRRWLGAGLLALTLLAACSTPCDPDACPGPEPAWLAATVRHGFETEAEFFAYSQANETGGTLKVVIPGLGAHEGGCRVDFLDPTFYSLHDEWRWMRRLAGVDVAGCDDDGWATPAVPPKTVAEAYAFFEDHDVGTYGLSRTGDRIVDCSFYRRIIGSCAPPGPLRYDDLPDAGGILWWVPANISASGKAVWAFQVYRWAILTPDELLARIETVQAHLPASIGSLRWLVNAADWAQTLALQERQADSPLGRRVVFEDELLRRDFAEGYTLGVTAGIPRRVQPQGAVVEALGVHDIALLTSLPDEIGPVAGIVSQTRQTPQAHLALLAASRGTPNAYAPMLFDDATLSSRASSGAPIALRVRADRIDWIPLDETQYAEWLERSTGLPLAVTPIGLDGLAETVALDGRSLPAARADVPRIGGKCAGMDILRGSIDAQDTALTTPPQPLCITVGLFAEVVQGIGLDVAALEDDPRMADPVVRFMVLEGLPAYLALWPGNPAKQNEAKKLFAAMPPGDRLGDLIGRGGVVDVVESVALDDVEAPWAPRWKAVKAALKARFSALAAAQALRLRSSSTVEDSAAFHGAGLYESETGWIHPAAGERPIAKAVAKVLGSYFRLPAWEERSLAGIRHSDGRMAVLVHPRFDDSHESANAVALLGAWLDDAGALHTRLEINAQLGSVSVTNPVAGTAVLPEIVRVVDHGEGPEIARLQASTELSVGQFVVADADAAMLSAHLRAVAKAWLEGLAQGRPVAEQPRAALLDFEFKQMAEGWPRRPMTPAAPERWIAKQVRPLSQRQRIPDAAFAVFPLPETWKVATREVRSLRCTAGPTDTPTWVADARWLALDPNDALLGENALLALNPWPTGRWLGAELQRQADAGPETRRADWPALQMQPTVLAVTTPTAPRFTWSDRRLSVAADGSWQLEASNGAGWQVIDSGTGASCAGIVRAESAQRWLETLFPAD